MIVDVGNAFYKMGDRLYLAFILLTPVTLAWIFTGAFMIGTPFDDSMHLAQKLGIAGLVIMTALITFCIWWAPREPKTKHHVHKLCCDRKTDDYFCKSCRGIVRSKDFLEFMNRHDSKYHFYHSKPIDLTAFRDIDMETGYVS